MLALVVILNEVYLFTSLHENDPLKIIVDGSEIPFTPILFNYLKFVLVLAVFTFLFVKSQKHSQIKKFSIIAFIGILLYLVEILTGWLPFWTEMEHDELLKWVDYRYINSLIWPVVLSVAVFLIARLFPSISLTFIGGMIFSILTLIRILSDFIMASRHVYAATTETIYDDLAFRISWAISYIGLALFFFGLTSNTKRNG